MPLVQKITEEHQQLAKERLIQQFKGKENIESIIDILSSEVGELEQALFDLLNIRLNLDAIESIASEPFSIVGGETLELSVNGEPPQTITFVAGDDTAQEVVDRINLTLKGAVAEVNTNRGQGVTFLIKPDGNDYNQTIEVVGGTSLVVFKISTGVQTGFPIIGEQLDNIGKILDQDREGDLDSTYRIILRAIIGIYISSGTIGVVAGTNDVSSLQRFIKLTTGSDVKIDEPSFPAFFRAVVQDPIALNGNRLFNLLKLAKPAGVGMEFQWHEGFAFTMGDGTAPYTPVIDTDLGLGSEEAPPNVTGGVFAGVLIG